MEQIKKKFKLNIKVSILVYLGLFLVSSFCFFINQMWIPLGFLLGGIIAIANFIILYEFSYYLTKPTAKYRLLNVLLYSSRMILYIIGFVICIGLDYLGFKIFFWGTCLVSYLLQKVINYFTFKQTDKK
jgi:hypothetical protein